MAKRLEREGMQKVFEKHLPYEIVRLTEMYELLLRPEYREKRPKIAETLDDALIVGFARRSWRFLSALGSYPK